MALALYMDHHVPRAITVGLRVRGVEVLTAEENGAKGLQNSELLDRAGPWDGYCSRTMMISWWGRPDDNALGFPLLG